jgi:hypothetical protein
MRERERFHFLEALHGLRRVEHGATVEAAARAEREVKRARDACDHADRAARDAAEAWTAYLRAGTFDPEIASRWGDDAIACAGTAASETSRRDALIEQLALRRDDQFAADLVRNHVAKAAHRAGREWRRRQEERRLADMADHISREEGICS